MQIRREELAVSLNINAGLTRLRHAMYLYIMMFTWLFIGKRIEYNKLSIYVLKQMFMIWFSIKFLFDEHTTWQHTIRMVFSQHLKVFRRGLNFNATLSGVCSIISVVRRFFECYFLIACLQWVKSFYCVLYVFWYWLSLYVWLVVVIHTINQNVIFVIDSVHDLISYFRLLLFAVTLQHTYNVTFKINILDKKV